MLNNHNNLKLYNTFTKQKEEFKPIIPGEISLYVCGITVYDYCHLGHARVFVAFDVIRRFLAFRGWKVKYIRNITDIDDKIIKRAAENNETIQSLTNRFIKEMDADSAALGVLKPDIEPRATEYIQQMCDLIQRLIDKNMAYMADNKDVYFSVSEFDSYGELGHKDLEQLQSGARVDIEQAKKNPLDFVLWKHSKPNEPAWDSPWGKGRPGWHIECSAMAMDCLGDSIDIHGGGADLKFPHHENERAQSEGATGKCFVNTWMHVGFVQIDKEKMSKSLNNFFTIKDILALYEGEVLRYFLLASHYRSPVNYSQESLELAKNALTTLYTALRGVNITSDTNAQIESNITDYETRFIDIMEDDFNTPEALVILFELAHDLNIAKQNNSNQIPVLAHTLKKLGNTLGLLEKTPDDFLQGVKNSALEPKVIEGLLEERLQARAAKNWARADAIREELASQNIIIEDTPNGSLWRQK